MTTTTTANAHQIGGTHYTSKSIQPWDYIIANQLGYLEGNVVKYVSRWRDKGGVQDLHKARHYLDKLLEVEQASCAAESGINPENQDARIVAGMAGALQDLTRPGESQSATSTSQPNQKHEL